MDRNFALPPIGKSALAFAFLLAVGVPLTIAIVLGLQARDGGLDPVLALATMAFVSLVTMGVLLPMWRRQVAFDGRRMRIKATWYTREAGLADFDLAAARIVDLREHTELRPVLKTNGFALPGLQAGHFRLRDWRRKAFCLVTDPSRVLALPHADGTLWLLSFEHPQAVLDILRRAAG